MGCDGGGGPGRFRLGLNVGKEADSAGGGRRSSERNPGAGATVACRLIGGADMMP